jgi:ubiquitin-conjugating enzyme E2 W
MVRSIGRIRKELLELQKVENQLGWTIETDETHVNKCFVTFNGPKGSIYECDGTFTLLFEFSENHPLTCPLVMFVGERIPIHPHVYSNGRICLSILGEEWTPVLTARTITLSIISMLTSATSKKRPEDNAEVVKELRKNPKENVKFDYHDDRV